ncbi:MAG TPA: PilN domain-containing protein [Lacipirellulaceae bacterium]|nr:PilN domain-containing protein [Lacipirellulaceae bacterium]
MSRQTNKDRRQQTDRRQSGSGERRRQGEGRCAIFEVCRSMLHLALVIRNNGSSDTPDRVVTRSVRWRNEAASLNTEQGITELTDAFRTLVSEERLSGAKVRIALSGEFCVTRVITGPTEDVRREFAELEERSLRYLTLGPGQKALAGSTQQLDARHQHALLAVANQRTLDVLMQIADNVNLQIESIEPSLIALSRAQAQLKESCKEAALLIQLDEGAAELGICHDGRLLLDYRPGGHANAENVAGIVAQHLSRLQRYIERYHSYLDAPLSRVYLAGDAAAVACARTKFNKVADFHVHVLEPADINTPWQYTGDTPGTDLSAALGTAMALYSDSSEKQGPNLIETALAQLREPIRPVLIRSLIPIAAVLLVAVSLFVLRIRQWSEITTVRNQLDELAPVCARSTELRLHLASADGKLALLKALDKQLPQPNWQQILGHVSQSMPDDVWLDRLTVHDGQSASLTGASYTDGGVYDFVGYLKQVPDVSEIALEGTGVGQSATGPTTNFTLQLTLANLADRNEKEARHD